MKNDFSAFIKYWIENIKQSKDSFDIVMLLAAAFFAVLCLVSPLIGFPKTVEEIFPENRVTWFLGIVAACFFVAWCFVWLPFRRHLHKLYGIPEEYAVSTKSKESPPRKR